MDGNLFVKGRNWIVFNKLGSLGGLGILCWGKLCPLLRTRRSLMLRLKAMGTIKRIDFESMLYLTFTIYILAYTRIARCFIHLIYIMSLRALISLRGRSIIWNVDKQSIDIDPPHSNKTKKIVINIGLKGHSISINIPEILSPSLHPLPLLHPKNHLNNILISIPSNFLQFIFDGVGYFLGEGGEVGGRGFLFGGEFLVQGLLYYLSRLWGLELFPMPGLYLVIVCLGLFGHLNLYKVTQNIISYY